MNKKTDYIDTQHLKSDLRSKAVRGAGATIAGQALAFIVHIGSTIVLARLLTPSDFGLVAIVTTFSLLLQNFGFNGFTEVIIQREDLNNEMVNALFWINGAISLGLTLVLAVLSPILVWFYDEPRLRMATTVIALSIIFSGMATIHLALLKRNMEFNILSAMSIVTKMLSAALAIALAWGGWGYWALVVNTISLPLFGAVIAWLFCGWRPGLPRGSAGMRSMVVYAFNVYGNFSLNYCARNFDNLMVGLRFGPLSLGYYKKAHDIFALPVSQLTAPLTDVAVATLSRLTKEPEKYRRYYLDAISHIAFVGMAISLSLTLTAKDIIYVILGPQWSTAGDIFFFLGPGIGFMLIYYTNGWLHLSLGRADRWLRWGVIELILVCLLISIGLSYGPTGVAAALTISYIILTQVGLWYAGRPINLTYSSLIGRMWRYILSATGAGLLCWYVCNSFQFTAEIWARLHIIYRIPLSLLMSISLYALLVVLFYRSLKPISQLINLGGDMLPFGRAKKSVA